jgi:hypothetical protein
MILPVNNNLSFRANGCEDTELFVHSDAKLLKNNLGTRTRISTDKLLSALTIYPAKGMKGSKNSNFYEFLTTGTVPYLVGSGMLMAIFNAANKFYSPLDRAKASMLGKKMALGVVLYGVMKEISKGFVTRPVKWFTGVDTGLPYVKLNYELPDNVHDSDITSIEYHKVFESIEFPRWDLLYGDEAKGEKRNKYYDKVARKLGLGKDLKDSDQEVKPRIKEIVTKTNAAKSLTSYLWAAAGVGFAFQQPWEKWFSNITFNFRKKEKFNESMKLLKESFKDSCKTYWHGDGVNGKYKHAGKILLLAAAGASLLGIINALSSGKKAQKSDVINKSESYVVN